MSLIRRAGALLTFFVGVSCLAALEPTESGGKTLHECFIAALKRSDTIATNQEAIRLAEQQYRQLIGTVIPNINGYGTYQLQANNPNQNFNSIYPNPSSTTKVTLTQPLFQGFKEFAGLRQGKANITAATHDKKQAIIQLYEDTSSAFFNVVSSERDVENVNRELGFYDQRIKELKQFHSIGRSPLTDVLTAESQKATLVGQLKQVEGTLKAQREILAFLTGWDAATPVQRPQGSEPAARPMDDYLARVDLRPDVKGDTARKESTEENIPIARAGHFPSLGFQADYYVQRTGALNGVNWDALLTLTVPIFSGGSVSAQVQEAVAQRDQAELKVSLTKRTAIEQIRTFYQNYLADKAQYDAYRESTELSEKNYREEIREFRLGLVTNLDVLTSLTTYMESQRSYDKSRWAMLLDTENLEASAVFRPEMPPSKKD